MRSRHASYQRELRGLHGYLVAAANPIEDGEESRVTRRANDPWVVGSRSGLREDPVIEEVQRVTEILRSVTANDLRVRASKEPEDNDRLDSY